MNESNLLTYYLQTVYDRGRVKVYFIYSTLVAILIAMVINQAMRWHTDVTFVKILLTSLMYSYSITFWVHLTTSMQLCITNRSKCQEELEDDKADECLKDMPHRGIWHVLFFIFLTELGVIAGTIQVVLIKHLFIGPVPAHVREQMPHPEFSIEHFVSMFAFSLGISSILLIGVFFYERLRLRFERSQAELKAKEVQAVELQRLKTQAELSALQAKINPHFLFNTLNSIASLISLDPSKAEMAVEKLSKLFRLTLDHSLKEEVLLKDSLKTVESYLELEQIRLGKRLRFDIQVEGDMSQTYVPGLLIQPLVENAVKYGISPSVEGGLIRIGIQLSEYCTIEIENTGGPWSEKASDSGHGLINIRERLALLYGENWAMEIQKDSPVLIRIRIPHKASPGVQHEATDPHY